MPSKTRARIFLSYARSDLAAARDLRQRIEADLGEGAVWHDVRDLAGDHWWSEIEDAIRGYSPVEHVVLLASAGALTRDVVRREWRLAWREGKTISNVFWTNRGGFDPPDLVKLPEWVRAKSMLDLSLPDRWGALIAVLKEPGQGPRRPFMAPAMPEGFVARPEVFAALKNAFLDAKGDAVATMAALRGAGGFGKTVLAQALAHDDNIQDAFHDGILWITLGERPNLLEKLTDLLRTLTGQPQGFTEITAATNKLTELLENRRCLLVLDDAWTQSHLRPFLEGAPMLARLIVTRRDDILPRGTLCVPVDAMKEAEAIELLSQGLGHAGTGERTALRTLATTRLGEWPVLIRLVNGFLRKEVERGVAALEAIRQANDRLDRKKLTYFDRNDEEARDAAVESTIRASLDYLVDEIGRGRDRHVYNRQRYGELAVFPEDVDVPIATIARLWARVAQIDDSDARDLLKDLYSLALLQALDLKRGTVRLHDVIRKYLTDQQALDALRGLHKQFIEAYDSASGPDIDDLEERRYFYTWFPTHLHEAGEPEVLNGLLLDPQWMQRKLDAVEVQPLIRDYRAFARPNTQKLIGQVLALAAGILVRHPAQLPSQLLARLAKDDSDAMANVLDACRAAIKPSSLITRLPTFAGPGPEILRLDIGESIYDIMPIDQGVLCAYGDGTLRLWDLDTGEELQRFTGHDAAATALARLDDRHVLSGSRDHTLRVWDLDTGAQMRMFRAHEDYAGPFGDTTKNGVWGLTTVDANHALSFGYQDCAIALWDLTTGSLIRVLKGHDDFIDAVALLHDRRVASTSKDGTLRLWSLDTGAELHRFELPERRASVIVQIDDNRILLGEWGGRSLILRDLTSDAEIRRFEGHEGPIEDAIRIDDRHLVSGADDATIRLWDLHSGAELRRIDGCAGWVTALAQVDDRRIVSASSDKVLRLWDVRSPAGRSAIRREAQVHGVQEVMTIDHTYALSFDPKAGAIDVWKFDDATRQVRLECHYFQRRAVFPRNDQVILPWYGNALQVCDLRTGARLQQIIFDQAADDQSSPRDLATARINDMLCVSVMGSTLRVWDLKTAAELRRCIGHEDEIWSVTPVDGNHVLSSSADGTVRLWDVRDARPVKTFEMSASLEFVEELRRVDDRRALMRSRRNSLHILDIPTGEISWLGMRTRRLDAALLVGHQCVCEDHQGTLQVWDGLTGVAARSFQGEAGSVNALAFSSNGRSILSISQDKTVRLWDWERGAELACLEGDAEFTSMAAHPGRSFAAVADALGRMHWIENVR